MRHPLVRLSRGLLSLALALAALPIQPAFAGETIHVVQSGETLFRIGLRYGVGWRTLMAVNGLTSITIYPGQQLIIPTGGAAFTQLIINATYHAYSPDNVAGAISLRGSITPDPFFYRATAGTFTFSGSDYVPSALAFIPAGWLVTIEGSVIMRVHNDQDEASLEFNRPGGVFPTGYGGDPSGQLTVVPLPAPSLAAGLGLIMIAARRRRRA